MENKDDRSVINMSRIINTEDMDSYKKLAHAIILQSWSDYVTTKRRMSKGWKADTHPKWITECENYWNSKEYELHCDDYPPLMAIDKIKQRLDEIAEDEENYPGKYISFSV